MQNFKFGSLTSDASSLLKVPQDGFAPCQGDFTSIFGTQKNTFLKEVPIKRDVENNETPFSYRGMLNNIFGELNKKDVFASHEINQPLAFEC